jgi:hypothetical protein
MFVTAGCQIGSRDVAAAQISESQRHAAFGLDVAARALDVAQLPRDRALARVGMPRWQT